MILRLAATFIALSGAPWTIRSRFPLHKSSASQRMKHSERMPPEHPRTMRLAMTGRGKRVTFDDLHLDWCVCPGSSPEHWEPSSKPDHFARKAPRPCFGVERESILPVGQAHAARGKERPYDETANEKHLPASKSFSSAVYVSAPKPKRLQSTNSQALKSRPASAVFLALPRWLQMRSTECNSSQPSHRQA